MNPPTSPDRPQISTEQLHAWMARRQRVRGRIKAIAIVVLVVGIGVFATAWTLFHQQFMASASLKATGFMVDWDFDFKNARTGGVTSVSYSSRWYRNQKIVASDLNPLKLLINLRSLDFRYLDTLGDDDLAILADLKELTDLQLNRSATLYRLGNPNMTLSDAVLDHVKGLTSLKILGLADNRITDAGLTKLANLTELESLDLENTRITDAGLETLKSFKKLKFLRIIGTSVTREGVRAFERAMPTTEVMSEEILPTEGDR